jgi:hypothetical protein
VWQGKDHMDVRRVEHLALSCGEPRGLDRTVTFGTAPMAAGVIGLLFVSTMIALGDMAAEGGGPAQGDSPQGSVLLARQGVPIALEKGGAMLAHHIGDFEWRATHGSVSRSTGNASASKGLAVPGSAGAATWR